MTYNYRCTRNSCRRRVTRRKKLEQYVQKKWTVCPSCGGRLSYDPEPKRRAKRDKCVCDGYPFPHRMGTEPWCKHAKVGPSDDDWRDLYWKIPGF